MLRLALGSYHRYVYIELLHLMREMRLTVGTDITMIQPFLRAMNKAKQPIAQTQTQLQYGSMLAQENAPGAIPQCCRSGLVEGENT